jgi:hypothetical protein
VPADDDQPCRGIDRPLDHEAQRATTVGAANQQPTFGALAGRTWFRTVVQIPRQLLGRELRRAASTTPTCRRC